MNFTILSRNSTAGTVYTDRPSYQNSHIPQPWKSSHIEHPHLNPSKSKVNVRNSLNKSGESFSLSNPNLDNIRGSCIVPKPNQHFSRQSLFDDKYRKSGKQNTEMSFQLNPKDSFIKFQNMNRTTVLEPQQRKRSDSSCYLRSSGKDQVLVKLDEELGFGKEQRTIEDIRSSIVALSKRMFLAEQQVSKLKDKREKEKKVQTLQHQFTQFQIQMFDICKKNTNYFSQFEDKIQKNSRSIYQIRERILYNSDKQQQREQINKKISLFESRIHQIHQTLNQENWNKIRYQNQNQSVLDNFKDIKLRLDKQAIESNEIMVKVHHLEKNIVFNKLEDLFRKDIKICNNPIILQKKQIITVKQNSLKEKIKNLGTPPSPIKEIKDYILEPKKQILIKQNVYYVDSQGYLLDQNQYYLLNSKNQHILIPQLMLLSLKQHNILISK